MLIEGSCTTGGRFFRRACGAAPIGQCVYCGAPFCAEHGELGVDYHEVCSRTSCRARYEDMLAHRVWLEAHSLRNATAMCAEDDCMDRAQHLCERCRLRFCDEHLSEGNVVDRQHDAPRKLRVMMCAHCASRRRIWD